MPVIPNTFTTTLLPGKKLTLKDLRDTYDNLSGIGIPDEAKVDIKKESPDRPGEMSLVYITVTWNKEISNDH